MKCDELKKIDVFTAIGLCSVLYVYDAEDVDEAIAELKAERDSFEKSFNEMTEAFIKSQRALWLARAERASDRNIIECLQGTSEMMVKWQIVERLCRKKVNEFKEGV